MLRRAALAALSAALLALGPALALPTLAGQAPARAATSPSDAVVGGPKIVIVVGAVESYTTSFRTDADSIYAEAIKYTSNVVKVYSPNATWAAVKAAAQGASIFIYLGHGYGFPSPYKTILTPTVHDGMGLNEFANQGDSDKKYYGESLVASDIRLAKDAIVILNHLCYSAGGSEQGDPEPTIPVAKQRVDNFASGFLRTGARAVMADSYSGNVISMIRQIFTTHQSLNTAWHNMWGVNGNDIVWTPLRNPAYTAVMDPDSPTSGFHRSIVGNLDLTTDQIVAGAAVPKTNIDPTSLQVPGAASVGAATLPVYADSAMTMPSGATLPAGAKLRVDQVVAADGSTPPAASVRTLDAATSGWVDSSGLVPRDSASPQLWAMDGETALTPNFDGDADALNLVARFSEPVPWTATISDPGGTAIRTLTGSGDSAVIGWVPLVGGVPVPDGTYTWAIHATDGWGNAPLDANGPITVASSPPPPTAVLGFAPSTWMTNAATLTYNLTFAGPVTGLMANDFTVTGSAAGCAVGAPVGSGTTWTISVGSCGTGWVNLQLEPGAVSDGSAMGPAGLIAAHWVIVDRSKPTTTAPKAGVRSNVKLVGASLQGSISWTGSDTGSAGVRDYDVARSTDGAAFVTIKTGLTTASLAVSLPAGHTYRFEVRAHDKANNVSYWAAGPTLTPAIVQQTSTSVTWAGFWTTTSSTSYSGGSARYSSAAGASMTYTFSGRGIGLTFGTGPTRGQVKAYVDGVYVSTIDTYAAASGFGWVGFARNFSAYGSHTLRLVVVGTASRPIVAVDAFEVLR